MVSVSRTLLRNLVNFGPFGHAEDLAKQIKVPWEIIGTPNSITIKTREWRGHTIVQGFQVHTQEGAARGCGMNYNDIHNTVTFDIPEDRRICQVRVAAASYIHSLGFVLDNGEILGPVGGEKAGKPIKTVVIPPSPTYDEILWPVGDVGVGGERASKPIEGMVISPTPLIQQQQQQQQQHSKISTARLCGISGISVHSEKAPVVAQVVFSFAFE